MNHLAQAQIALERVEAALTTIPKGSRPVIPKSIGQFLKDYMLGLISDINDMLHDVQGRKSLPVKRKIIRSLGALVRHIGPGVTNVAPQVSNKLCMW